MDTRRSVLVVDPLEETREVLKAALAARGVDCVVTHRADHGRQLFRDHHPDLVVLDIELEQAPRAPDRGAADDEQPSLAESMQDDAAQLVILGTARPESPGLKGGAFLSKPYQYGTLIRKIEAMLANARRAA